MTNRSPFAVFLLSLVTGGIYGVFWYYWTKQEMNSQGADIPTLWLIIIPFVNYYWLWKYSEGVEKVTKGSLSGPVAFLLMFLLGSIGAAIIQDKFNSYPGGGAGATAAA